MLYKRNRASSIARVEAMKSVYDFHGKHVLDIGCADGFIARQLSASAKTVFGVDLDTSAAVVKAEPNTYFFNREATPAWIRSQRKFDCVIYLSVIQHVMADLGRWKQSHYGISYAVEVLEAIRSITDTMFFEIALPGESSPFLRNMPETWHAAQFPYSWVMHNLLQPAGFYNTWIVSAPVLAASRYQYWMHSKFGKVLKQSPSLVRDLVRFDDRDARPLFFCR